MARKVNIVGTQPKRARVVDKPRRRIEPAELAAALGAEPCGEPLGVNLDPISLAELGTELLRRLRSSGGRPALADATEYCRVPLSAEDIKALEKITARIEQSTRMKPSPGQVASVIVRHYVSIGSANAQDPSVIETLEDQVNKQMASIAACVPRLAAIISDAGTLQTKAQSIETTAKEIKEEIDRSVVEILSVLRRDRK